jgi:hypothetical protein
MIPAMSLRKSDTADYYACPGCGAEVRVGSRGCPKCTDKPRSWEQDEACDGADLPDEEFDYDDFVRREFGRGSARVKPPGLRWYWWLTAIILLILMVWSYVAGL